VRIVLNTRADDAGSRICIHSLGARLNEQGADAVVNDWDSYDRYDVAVFMGYDHELEAARRANPGIKVVLADPKLSRPEWIAAARSADLLLVSSLEQRDVFVGLNRNVLVHHMFPPVPARERRHADGDRVVIAYHGNRAHLESMASGARAASEELARGRKIEFRAVYNVSRLGRARLGLPAGDLVVREIQWEPDAWDALADADIGIVPTELPVARRLDALELTALPEPVLSYEPFDHLVRFKASANPGRIFPFARLGIPVVVDFVPSLNQFVDDGASGFVASSPAGWLYALERLADSAQLRASMAAALRKRVDAVYDQQVTSLLEALELADTPSPVGLDGRRADDELAALSRYPAFRPPFRRRLGWRMRRALRR
jgi:glycosyltransferase involved in cell wall biosynthesis